MINQTASSDFARSAPTAVARPSSKDDLRRTSAWHRLALAGVLLLALFLHFFRLEDLGYGNQYYAAAVKSMLTSWHNFFYVSFDPGGFVSVDKPPLGLWTQALSAMIFGFNGWALMLPQALAGVLSVALLYHLVRRVFGPTAGVIAALVLALTPISLAANRNNTMDSQLVLTSLLAAWAVSLAAERGKLRWLLLCAFFVGLGFNIKMLQAVMVLPAFYSLYLFAPIAWWKRLVHLALASVVLAVVSLAWVVAVDLTPPDQRPFVGSSHDNTVTELIIGHNGMARLGMLGRLIGGSGPRAGGPPPSGQNQPPPDQFAPGIQPPLGGQLPAGVNPPLPNQFGPGNPPRGGQNPFLPPGNQPPLSQGNLRQGSQPPGGQPPGGPGQNETGAAGPFRLFNQQLAGQTSWLLPLAALGLVAAAWQVKLRWPLNPPHQALILWGAWLAPQMVFFSYAGLFHRYYLEMLAPAIAALVGAGMAAMWNDYQRHGWRGWLLPLALIAAAALEAYIVAQFPDWSRWLTPLVVGLCAVAVIALIVLRLIRNQPSAIRRLPSAIAALGLLSLLIAPAAWSATVLIGSDAGLPFAGPEVAARAARPGGNVPRVDRLVEYLTANRNGEKFLAATLNANSAAPIILATGEPVMALGGFSGSDNILSAEELAAKVEQGEVRFFLLPQSSGPNVGPGGNRPQNAPGQRSDTLRWVAEHCTAVPSSAWQSVASAPPPGGDAPPPAGGPGSGQQLFDCGRGS
jgi:4-amino-4-deoxy-L-arabinose transferase-like glycosyltransferase